MAGTSDRSRHPNAARKIIRRKKPSGNAMLACLWREGRREPEIAEALDLEVASVGPYVRELRDAGEHLPYRRPPRCAAEMAARCRRHESISAD